MSVGVNPPKTPVTKGSTGIACATLPNICKMPGPPAPFVPTPLPNIGKSGMSPKDYSKKVKIENKPVAIRGATFKSMGDVASKALGGGMVSLNTHGPTKFIGPGSLNVKIEGKNVQLLSDPMLNNCGPSGSPANAATLVGLVQAPTLMGVTRADLDKIADECNKRVNAKMRQDGAMGKPPSGAECREAGTHKHKCCEDSIKEYNKKNPDSPLRSEQGFDKNGNPVSNAVAQKARDAARKAGKKAYNQAYHQGKKAGMASQAAHKAANKVKSTASRNAFRNAGGPAMIPDVVVVDPPTTNGKPTTPQGGSGPNNNIKKVYDFKFNCKHTQKESKKHPERLLNKNQKSIYKRLTKNKSLPSVIHRRGNLHVP